MTRSWRWRGRHRQYAGRVCSPFHSLTFINSISPKTYPLYIESLQFRRRDPTLSSSLPADRGSPRVVDDHSEVGAGCVRRFLPQDLLLSNFYFLLFFRQSGLDLNVSTTKRLQLFNFPSSASTSFQTRSVTTEADSARASAAD
jgi:hypothetical protein